MIVIRLVVKFFKWAIIAFFVSTVLAVLVYKWVNVPVTPLMLVRSVQNMSHGKSPSFFHKWVALKDMSRYMPVAVQASEDQNFMHPLWLQNQNHDDT